MTDRPRARERRHELGEVPPDERVRLAATFGSLLRYERGLLTQQQLADAAGLDRRTIDRLENGRRRPSAASIWRIARALRSDLRSRVALDERLRQAAKESFRDYGRRPHRQREEMRAALLREAGDGVPVADGDTLGAALMAALSRATSRGSDGGR